MKQCCEKYTHQSQPRKPQNIKKFQELQICNCGTKLKITFEKNDFLGGETIYTPVSAEEVK